jgi:hypothetical protein
MRRLLFPAYAAALLLAAGCAAPGGTPLASSPPPSSSSGSSSPVPLWSPSASAPPAVIPAAAVLQPDDLDTAQPAPVPEGEQAHLRPIRPCDARYPSDATRTAAVAVKAQVAPGHPETPRVVFEYIGLHPGKAAEAYADLVAAVKRCPGSLDPGKRTWQIAATGLAGDESMLVRVGERFTYGDNQVTTTTPVLVARVGDHILVVADLGWESTSGDEPYVKRLAGSAVQRLRTAR